MKMITYLQEEYEVNEIKINGMGFGNMNGVL